MNEQMSEMQFETSNATSNAAADASNSDLCPNAEPEFDASADESEGDDAYASLIAAAKAASLHGVRFDAELTKAAKAFAASRSIGPDDICGKCGGRGHYSTVDGKQCLTVVLGNKIPLDELMQTKYPRSLKFPNFNKGPKQKFSKAAADSAQSSSRSSRSFARSPRSPGQSRKPHLRNKKSQYRKYPNSKGKARVADTQNEVSDDESQSSNASDDSAEMGKLVSSLAINYSHIDVTPPPSPPSEKADCDFRA